MLRVDSADWVPEGPPVRAVPTASMPTAIDRSRGGAAIPAAEIETLLRTVSKALALGAADAEGAGYRLLCNGRVRIESLDHTQYPWAAMLVLYWCRIQEEYLARHPGADHHP